MLVSTTISFILGKNVIFQISCEQELLKDHREGDIYEEFEDKDKKSIKISKIRYFNKGKFLIKIKQYKYELIFNHEFNEPVNLPKSLTHLTFGQEFGQPINLPDSITHLTLGFCFNQSINLPKSLTHLTLGYWFNQPINLPKSLIYLKLSYWFNQLVELPKSLTHLKIYSHQKDLKVKYNNEIIEIQNLPIKIDYYY